MHRAGPGVLGTKGDMAGVLNVTMRGVMSAASLDVLQDCGNGRVVSLVLLVEEVVLALIERGRKNE